MTSWLVVAVAEISNITHRRKLALSQSFFKISCSNFLCEFIEPFFRQQAQPLLPGVSSTIDVMLQTGVN